MHRHRAQRYRIEFFSNRMEIPILYTMICSFQGGGEMGLIITWSLVVRMPFYCCLGTLHQAVFMKLSSCDLQEKSWSHQLSVKLPDLGLDQDHYPKVRVSSVENLLPNSNSSAPVTWYQEGFLKMVSLSSVFMSHTKEPSRLHLKQILPSNLLKTDRSSPLAFSWKP